MQMHVLPLACLLSSVGSIPAIVDQCGSMWVHFTGTDGRESHGCAAAAALSCIVCVCVCRGGA